MNIPGRQKVELCDACAAIITDGSEVHAFVGDSSAVSDREPEFDGLRLLTACSRPHLAELARQYAGRPFVDAELWTGIIVRALRPRYPHTLTLEELVDVTSLTEAQIEAAVDWDRTG